MCGICALSNLLPTALHLVGESARETTSIQLTQMRNHSPFGNYPFPFSPSSGRTTNNASGSTCGSSDGHHPALSCGCFLPGNSGSNDLILVRDGDNALQVLRQQLVGLAKLSKQ